MKFRLPPIARRDVGAAHARFELAVVGHELEVDAGAGQAHIGGVLGGQVRASANGRGLGRAEAGEEQDALAAGFDRELLDLVEHVLGDAGAGEPQHLQAREEVAAQLRRRRADNGSSAS